MKFEEILDRPNFFLDKIYLNNTSQNYQRIS